MVLGISLPSIPLQGKKVVITVEHLACGRGDIQGKGAWEHGNKRAGRNYLRYGGSCLFRIYENHPNIYYLGTQKIGKLNLTSSKIYRLFDFLQIYEEKNHSLNGISRIS